MLFDFSLKVVKEDKLLDAKKLLTKGLIILSRGEDNTIIPLKNHLDKVSDDEIYIRYGQLNSKNKIIGIGRKISIKPKYYASAINDFVEEKTYIEEGEFKNDTLNGTFGRRIEIKGTTRVGWF